MKHKVFGILIILLISAASQSQDTECDSTLSSGDTKYRNFKNYKALDIFTTAHKECPDNFEALMKSTRAYIDAGEDTSGSAAESFFIQGMLYADTMMHVFPDSVQSYFLKSAAAANLAMFKGGKERVKLARIIERNAKKAVSLDPSYAPPYAILGGYYREVANISPIMKFFAKTFFGDLPDGTLEDSEYYYKKTISLQPDNIYAHIGIARTYLSMNETQKATYHLEKVMELPVSNHYHPVLKRESKEHLEILK
ncbi:MAG: tetratricopeptide repeat protein [Chitinivibrionales bacterium]